jgi:hypothetical protein
VSGHFGFRVVLGRVGSDIRSSSIGSFRVSGRIRSSIGSSSVGSFQVSDRIRSCRVEYRVVQCRDISGYGSYKVRAGRTSFSGRVGFCELWPFSGPSSPFISCTLYSTQATHPKR